MTTATLAGQTNSSAGSLPRPSDSHTKSTLSFTARLEHRKWALIAALVVVVVGMAYMLAWYPIVHHIGIWTTPGDVWGVLRAAHYVGWGYLGGVYDPSTGVVSFPGIEILLAPLAMLSGSLHLTESMSPIFLRQPSAAMILQPVELALTGSVIFATDALAERLAVPQKRRVVLCFVVALTAFPVAAIWGHAEDALALTFGIYALLAMLDRRWGRCGWLLGLGVLMQPLLLMVIPLVIGASPKGQRAALAIRSTLLAGLVLVVAFAGAPSNTYRAVVQQPAVPGVNHDTPWLAFSPRLPSLNVRAGEAVAMAHHVSHFVLTTTHVAKGGIFVAGGVGRSLYVVLAIVLGLFAWRRPQHPLKLLWLAAVILAARCFFEAVMCPYYLAPPLFVALVLVARTSGRRFVLAVLIAIFTSLYAYLHFSPWVWWLPVLAGLTAVLALGLPDRKSLSSPWGELSDCGPAVVDLSNSERDRPREFESAR